MKRVILKNLGSDFKSWEALGVVHEYGMLSLSPPHCTGRIMLFTSPVGYFTTPYTRAKHFKAIPCQEDLDTSGSQPCRPWDQLSQTSMGKTRAFSASLRTQVFAWNVLFQFVNTTLEKILPGSLLCCPPTLSQSFPWTCCDPYLGRRWLRSVVSKYHGGLGGWPPQGHHTAFSVPPITLLDWDILSPLEKDFI